MKHFSFFMLIFLGSCCPCEASETLDTILSKAAELSRKQFAPNGSSPRFFRVVARSNLRFGSVLREESIARLIGFSGESFVHASQSKSMLNKCVAIRRDSPRFQLPDFHILVTIAMNPRASRHHRTWRSDHGNLGRQRKRRELIVGVEFGQAYWQLHQAWFLSGSCYKNRYFDGNTHALPSKWNV